MVRFLLEHLDSEAAAAGIVTRRQGLNALEVALQVGTCPPYWSADDAGRRRHIAFTVSALLLGHAAAGPAATNDLLHGMVNHGRRDMTPLLYHLSLVRHGPAAEDDPGTTRWCCARTLQVLLDAGSNTAARYGRGGRCGVLDAVAGNEFGGCRGCSEVLIMRLGHRHAQEWLDTGVKCREWFTELVEAQRLREMT